MKRFTALLLAAVLLISSFAFAAPTPLEAGQKLKEMGFIKGDENGNLQTDKVLTREEALVTILRLKDAESNTASKAQPFLDVPQDHWAVNQIAYGYEAGIVKGMSKEKFGLGQKVTTKAYLTMLLRVLGYNNDDTYATAMEKSKELKILDGVQNSTDMAAVTRGDAFIMIYNTLNTNLADSQQTLLASLQSDDKKTMTGKDYAKAYSTATLPDFEAKANQVVVTDDSVTFVDARDKEITVEKNPQKVIGLYPSHIIFWYQAGGEMIARVSTKSSEKKMPAAAKDIEIIAESTSPDTISLEKILVLKPDLVVLGMGMGKQVAFADKIDQLGIQTIVIDNETLTDYMKWVKVIANINSKPELYDEAVQNVLTPINQLLLKVPAENNPKAMMMQVNKKGTLVAYRSGTTAAGMMHDLKAINVAETLSDQAYDKTKGVDKVTLSFESVLQDQPQLILLKHSSRTKNARQVVADNLADNAVWKSYNAVKDDAIYDLPPNFYHYKPMNKYFEAYQYMAKILYPEIFGEQSKTYE